jgi:hypothetical protein
LDPHDAVIHPDDLLAASEPEGRVARGSEWLAGHLAVVFGLAGTVWVFMTVPLLVLLAPTGVRSVVFYLASGWIQLWALPLFVFTGNRLQRSADAQSQAQHQALTHIATTGDEVHALSARVYDLTAQVYQLTLEAHATPPAAAGPSTVLQPGAINKL